MQKELPSWARSFMINSMPSRIKSESTPSCTVAEC
jgi:hypothetical protein